MSMYPVADGRSSCSGRMVVALVMAWTSAASLLAQLWAWGSVAVGITSNPFRVTIIQVVVMAAPLLPLVIWWRPPRERAIFRAWLLATAFVLILAPSRLWEPARSQEMMVTQLVLSLIFGGVVWRLTRAAPAIVSASWARWLSALPIAGLVALPWFRWGALGSWLDTLLALALGLMVGVIVGRIIGATWFAAVAVHPRGRTSDIFAGGLVVGTTLLIVGSGLAFNGVQLALMLAASSIGWITLALAIASPVASPNLQFAWQPVAVMSGALFAFILALVDPDSLSLVIFDPNIGIVARTALVAVGLGWVLALVALALDQRWGGPVRPRIALPIAVALWAVGGVTLVGGGAPITAGDHLFVVLKHQADVSAAAEIADYDERRRFVYQTLVDHGAADQRELRALLDQLGVAYRPYYLVNALEVEGGLPLRLLLERRPEVDRVLPNPILRPLREALPVSRGGADPPTQPAWNLTNLGADRVWDEFGVRGANIVVGQADSGVQWDHPELLDAYRGQAEGHDGNWLDPWSDTAAPIDYNGHGTHTLGSVLGNTVGVAPDATWFACANLQRNLGNPARYLDCLQFLFAPYPQHGDPWRDGDPTRSAHVLNNSWGCPREFEGCDPTSLLPAVRALRAAGIFVVASAGNEGPECATIADPLALYDESFTVGAVDRLGRLARFSSVGPVTVDGSNRTKPDVLAPGVRILSAFPDSTYARVDGTSMAGPHVVGVVALMWSANPSLIGDIERTEAILAETARPYMGGVADLDAFANNEETQPVDLGSTCVIQTDLDIRPNDIAGFGLVDAYAAVERALAAPGA